MATILAIGCALRNARPDLDMMMSMSGGWFFVVAAEAISVGDTTIKLPGIGSYLAFAIEQKRIDAVIAAIITMFIVILAYDQFLFRPLVAFGARFRVELSASQTQEKSWVAQVFKRAPMGARLDARSDAIFAKRLPVAPRASGALLARRTPKSTPQPDRRCLMGQLHRPRRAVGELAHRRLRAPGIILERSLAGPLCLRSSPWLGSFAC